MSGKSSRVQITGKGGATGGDTTVVLTGDGAGFGAGFGVGFTTGFTGVGLTFGFGLFINLIPQQSAEQREQPDDDELWIGHCYCGFHTAEGVPTL